MPSSVIHIRLDDWALIGCYDILDKGGREVVNLPSATIVREVVNGLVRRMQSSKHIPTYTKEERLARAREIYGGEFFLDPDLEPGQIADVSDTVEEEIDREDMSNLSVEEIAKKVQQSILESKEPHIETPVEMAEEVEEPRQVIQKINLLDFPSELSFDEVKSLAPKDRMIEWAVTSESEVIQKAVAICYSNIARELWGSTKAEEIISKLCKSHQS